MQNVTAGPGSVATDETEHLISSSKVEGTAVYDRRGERLGTVSSFMVNKFTGQVAYALMSFGGFLGMRQSCHPLPWTALSYDTGKGGYVVDLDKETLRAGPCYASGESSALHEGSVVKRAGASFTSFRPCEHRRLGSGAVPRRSHGCVTLHAVGPGPRSRTRMPLARGVAPARRDPPGTRRRIATLDEDGRAPRAAAGGRPRGGGLVCYAATSTPSGTRPVSA